MRYMLNPKKEYKPMIKTRKTIIFALATLLVLGVIIRFGLAWDDGCTQGFWKNHPEAWPAHIQPGDDLADYFVAAPPELLGDTLMDALNYRGGKGYLGAARILLRTAVTAMLNIEHSDVEYIGYHRGFPFLVDLQDAVNDALNSGDRECMLVLSEDLDYYNNWGCPLGD